MLYHILSRKKFCQTVFFTDKHPAIVIKSIIGADFLRCSTLMTSDAVSFTRLLSITPTKFVKFSINAKLVSMSTLVDFGVGK